MHAFSHPIHDRRPNNNRCLLFFVALCVSCFVCVGATSADEGDPPISGKRQHSVSLDKFLQLRAGLKKGETEQLLGGVGEHQFTFVDKDGHVWQCAEYAVAKEPRYASSGFDLLYKDGVLDALIDSTDAWNHYKALQGVQPRQIEDPEKRQKRIRRRRPVAFHDEKRVLEFFHIKSLRGESIAGSMPIVKKRILDEEIVMKGIETRNPPDPGLTVVVGVIDLLNPSARAETKRAYKTNAEFMTRFDGGKVAIGLTEAQVEEVFGKPLLSENMGDSQRAMIYGPKDTTAIAMVPSYLACQPVMVLYRNDLVVRVLSNSFFDTDWRDKVWPELKSPE